MGLLPLRKSAAWLGALAALMLAFQNCSKSPRANSEKNLASLSGGNGTGYDGKPYVLGDCPNSTEPRRRVRLKAQGALAEIERDACADLAPPYQEVTVSRFDPVLPEGLVINSEAYAIESLGRRFTRLCSGIDNRRPVQVQFWADGATENRAEVLRFDTALTLVDRGGALTLNAIDQSPLRYESVETYQGPGAFTGDPLLRAELTGTEADVTYYLPRTDEFSVAPNLECVLNP